MWFKKNILKRSSFVFLLIFLVSVFNLLIASVNSKNTSSTLEVASGAHFVVENEITDFQGKLIEEDAGGVEGLQIGFNNGVFKSAGSEAKFTGNLDLSSVGEVVLNGVKTFKGKRGEALKKVKVSGANNRLEGVIQLSEGIELADSLTSVTCALQGRLACPLVLNGGSLFLEEDLHFVDEFFFTGSGAIRLNRRNLILGSTDMDVDASLYFDEARDIALHANLHLAETWTFSGSGVIEGNGKILYLEEGGEIVVEQGSSLLLQNIIVHYVSGNNIRCLDSNATLSFQNVTVVLDGNYSFTTGAIEVIEDFRVRGPHVFAYQSAQTSTVWSYGSLIFDRGTTFSFDPIWNTNFSVTYDSEDLPVDPWDMAQDFLSFEDEHAGLELKGASLYVTTTGLKLRKGTFLIKDRSEILTDLDEEFHMEEGLVIGNNNVDEDMTCILAGGATLNISQGAFSYKNIDSSSWTVESDYTLLRISSGAKLKLHQSLASARGVVLFDEGSVLSRASGKKLESPIHVGGAISYEVCYN